jgi:hypothetical protein
VTRRRPARIELLATLRFEGARAGAFTGEFVALPAVDADVR